MRVALLIVPALALLTACDQEPMKFAEPAPKPGIELAFDVPHGAAAQIVHVVTRDIPPNGKIPWHTHPGVEIAYVESGNVELEMAGQDKQRLGPGGHFTVPRGTVHSGMNIGKENARLVLTYVVDKGAPLRSPAEAPEEQP